MIDLDSKGRNTAFTFVKEGYVFLQILALTFWLFCMSSANVCDATKIKSYQEPKIWAKQFVTRKNDLFDIRAPGSLFIINTLNWHML